MSTIYTLHACKNIHACKNKQLHYKDKRLVTTYILNQILAT